MLISHKTKVAASGRWFAANLRGIYPVFKREAKTRTNKALRRGLLTDAIELADLTSDAVHAAYDNELTRDLQNFPVAWEEQRIAHMFPALVDDVLNRAWDAQRRLERELAMDQEFANMRAEQEWEARFERRQRYLGSLPLGSIVSETDSFDSTWVGIVKEYESYSGDAGRYVDDIAKISRSACGFYWELHSYDSRNPPVLYDLMMTTPEQLVEVAKVVHRLHEAFSSHKDAADDNAYA